MAMRDPHRFVNELDEAAIERLIARLEGRAQDPVFARLFDKCVTHLSFPPQARVLEIGCGTGAMMRLLARRSDFSGTALGIDQSQPFIEAARRFAADENVSDRVEFRRGDAHNLEFPSEAFDAVIANTVISHVTEPSTVIREMVRVLRPGGSAVVFDGDYASLTYAYPDHAFGHQMDAALMNAVFNNPRIMRELPRMLADLGLRLASGWGDAVAEIGTGSNFPSFAETYVPSIKDAGVLPREAVDAWLAWQRQATQDGTFFASCTYYTYLIQRA